MSVPFSVVMIKPLSIGRGHGPEILGNIIDRCPVTLRKIRSWVVCDTTLFGISRPHGPHLTNLNYDDEKIHPQRQAVSWICVFTHIDRETDPYVCLDTYFGPTDPRDCKLGQLRHTYGGLTQAGLNFHPSDNVVHLALPERADFEATLLFQDFDPTKI